tara:strand:+ start:846 stop:1031 length:186 start_codon:yes stop_codon:yes gene_type:complete
MIRVFNSAYKGERLIPMSEAKIHDQKIDDAGRPYILFEHEDYPLGGLYAWFDGTYWQADLN